jgi:hypothetical protein
MVPVVGGIAGLIGVLLFSLSLLRIFWWIPPIADLGCGPLLVATAIAAIKRKVRH